MVQSNFYLHQVHIRNMLEECFTVNHVTSQVINPSISLNYSFLFMYIYIYTHTLDHFTILNPWPYIIGVLVYVSLNSIIGYIFIVLITKLERNIVEYVLKVTKKGITMVIRISPSTFAGFSQEQRKLLAITTTRTSHSKYRKFLAAPKYKYT